MITPVEFKSSFMTDSIVAIAAGLLLWIGVAKDMKLKRPIGVIMLITYAIYFGYLVI